MSFPVDTDNHLKACLTFSLDFLEKIIELILAADDGIDLAHAAERGKFFFRKLLVERNDYADSACNCKVRLSPLVAVSADDADV